MAINSVHLAGNLTRDPEMRATQSGSTVMTFSIAVNERRKNPQTGSWEDEPHYFDCTMFGKRAEAVSQYLYKGMKVAIGGKLEQQRWQDKATGKGRSKVGVIVNEIEFMSQGNTQPTQKPRQASAPVVGDIYGDDIPF